MTPLVEYWAGAERTFRLDTGGVMEIEASCGRVGIGVIYKRIATHDFFVHDLKAVLQQALLGGGMSAAEVKELLRTRFDEVPMSETVQVVFSILLRLVEGIAGSRSGGDAEDHAGPPPPLDAGAIFGAFARLGIPPAQVREMRFDDFIAMLTALGRPATAAPTEEEFLEMLERHGEMEVLGVDNG